MSASDLQRSSQSCGDISLSGLVLQTCLLTLVCRCHDVADGGRDSTLGRLRRSGREPEGGGAGGAIAADAAGAAMGGLWRSPSVGGR